jgi:hypothetical protein
MTIEKAEKRRRIKRGTITHVSLCRRAMNQLPVLMKSGDRVQIDLLTKMDGDLLHALVYVPEENGAVDFEGDVAPAAVIKQMAHDFLANGGGIDIEHNLSVLGNDKVKIAETFLVQKGDARFQGWKDYNGRPVNAEGSWAMILKVLDPKLREQVASGEINGVSMFGHAEVELLTKNSPPTNSNTNTMTPEQMQAFAEMLTKSLAAALKPNTPAATPTAHAQSVNDIPFEGDPLNSEDIAKHMDKLMLARVNWNDPASIAKYQGHVAKRQAEVAKAQAKPQDELEQAKAELAKAQEKLAKLTKASGAPTEEKPEAPAAGGVGLSKSEQAQMAAAREAVRKMGLGKSPAK